jgi:hypothetical protein
MAATAAAAAGDRGRTSINSNSIIAVLMAHSHKQILSGPV